MPTVTFTNPGGDTFNWKDGVSKADVECWGGGQGGDANGGSGGIGGSYAKKLQISRSGATDTVQVGAGGASSTAGGDSYFRTTGTVQAKGGGSGSSNVGDTTFTGGAGGTGDGTFGGGGGGAAGDANNGSAGGNASGSGGTGGNGGATGGGTGGNGSDAEGQAGESPGGGGGGGGVSFNAGTGGNGQVKVTTVAGNLAYSQQPSNANSGVAISPAITGLIRRTDAANATDTDATGNVTIEIATGSGSLSGTLTVAAVAGVFTFSNVIVTGSGAHTLRVTHADCTSATSNSFDIAAAAGQPTVKRLGGVPHMRLGGPTFGNGGTW